MRSIFGQTTFVDRGQLFIIDHPRNCDINSLKAAKQNKMNDVIMLEAGAAHFLALRQIVKPSFENWTVQMVAEWIPTIGQRFNGLSNVIVYGKYDGKKFLEEFGNDFMINTLGISGENEQIKLTTELSNVKSEKILSVQLYGWGDNSYGQLATFQSQMLSAPKLIDIPDVFMITEKPEHLQERQQFIKQVSCGKRHSALVSSNGNIWICGNHTKTDKPKMTETEKQILKDKEFA